jgi:hypothetical protein
MGLTTSKKRYKNSSVSCRPTRIEKVANRGGFSSTKKAGYSYDSKVRKWKSQNHRSIHKRR